MGTPTDYSNEAMESVDMSAAKWGGRAARTVWRITAAAKRMMDDSEVPVFRYDPAGGTTWEVLTPTEIWYGAGYIVTAALAEPSVVQCVSGHYLTPTQFFGCATKSFTDKTAMQEITCYGDTAVQRYPTITDWDGKLEAFVSKVQASATTTGGATNGNVKLYHAAGGTAGNGPTLTFTDTDQAVISITIAATDDITVDMATSGGTITSTANDVIAALNAKAEVIALGLKACLAEGENGTGLVAAGGPWTLSGGLDYMNFTGQTVQASATSTGAAANGHLTVYHVAGGTVGNGITFDLQDNNEATLGISVVATDIVVSLKTSGGTPISTANEIIAALNTNADFLALGLRAKVKDGENGSGVAADAGPFTLANGSGAKGFLGSRAAFRFYTDYANGELYSGFGYISDVDWIGGPTDLLQAGLSIQGDKYQLRHVRESYA